MDAIPPRPLAAGEPVAVDFGALPPARLADMAEAARTVLRCQRDLAAAGSTVLDEILRGQGPFVQWDHYPAGDVYDRASRSQYYYHAHPPDHRGNEWGDEHGHFHTFLREPTDGDGGGLCHLVAVSMSRDGLPVRLFTTNRWVTDESWRDAEAVIAMTDRFKVDGAVPSPTVNAWLGGLLRLFRPQIEELLRRRDAALADWQARFARPNLSAFDDRDLEVASAADISVEDQVAGLSAAITAPLSIRD